MKDKKKGEKHGESAEGDCDNKENQKDKKDKKSKKDKS